MKRFRVFKLLKLDMSMIKKALAMLTLLKIAHLILGILPLYLYDYFINHILIGKNISKLWIVVIGYLVVFLFETTEVMEGKKFSNRLLLIYDLKIKNKLLKKFSSFDNEISNIGDIRNLIEKDSAVAGQFFIQHILEYIYAYVYAIVLGIILIYYDWKIALISFIFIPIAFITISFLGDKAKESGEELRRLQTKYETFLHSTFQNWKDIKINNLEDMQFEELNKHYKKIRPVLFKNKFYLHIGVTFSFFIKNFVTQLFIYIIGGYFVIKGYSKIGTLLVFTNFYGVFFKHIESIGNSIVTFKNDCVSIEKVIELLDYKIENKPYVQIHGEDVVVENLKFGYERKEEFFLKNISFTVKKGEHLAIVGESGSGKSTIAKLLTKQVTPQEGSIKIGGIDICSVNSRSVLEKVGVVAQESILFNMTIRENLLLVKADASEEELIKACIKASIYDFILSLPSKFDTVIGESGVKLSGGQRQRLSLARTFLQSKTIMIFDESTSALDSEKETDIVTEIRSQTDEKTMISIAHRLSTILDCDKVMVLHEGKIVGLDTHDNLRNNCEVYDFLFENQYIAD